MSAGGDPGGSPLPEPNGGSVTRAARLIVGVVLVLGALAAPAAAEVTGGCDGWAEFGGQRWTPANDTKSNPIIVPDEDTFEVTYFGEAPFDNNNHQGGLSIQLGPASIDIGQAQWSDDDPNAPNSPSSEGSTTIDLAAIEDASPVPLAGIYRVNGTHTADGGTCEGFVLVKFDGGLFASPIGVAAGGLSVVALAILLFSMVASGAVGAATARRGKPILAAFAGLVGGLALAVFLQQGGVWPLDNLTVLALPIVLALLGVVLALWAPFGGAKAAGA